MFSWRVPRPANSSCSVLSCPVLSCPVLCALLEPVRAWDVLALAGGLLVYLTTLLLLPSNKKQRLPPPPPAARLRLVHPTHARTLALPSPILQQLLFVRGRDRTERCQCHRPTRRHDTTLIAPATSSADLLTPAVCTHAFTFCPFLRRVRAALCVVSACLLLSLARLPFLTGATGHTSARPRRMVSEHLPFQQSGLVWNPSKFQHSYRSSSTSPVAVAASLTALCTTQVIATHPHTHTHTHTHIDIDYYRILVSGGRHPLPQHGPASDHCRRQ